MTKEQYKIENMKDLKIFTTNIEDTIEIEKVIKPIYNFKASE